MRRTLAATAIAALALTVAPSPAQAQEGDDPINNQRVQVQFQQPDTSADLSGTTHVKIQATETFIGPRVVNNYVVSLHNTDGSLIGDLCQEQYTEESGFPPIGDPENGGPAFVLEFDWDTNRYPTAASTSCDGGNPALPASGAALPNGEFVIKATVMLGNPVNGDPGEGEEQNTEALTVKISNGVAAPTGVKLERSGDNITVSWAKNGEVDLAGYRVQECIVDRSSKPCEKWEHRAEAAASHTSVSVPHAGPGIYRYRVAAVRPDASGNAIVSDYTGPKSDPTEILVEEPPPPTTTTTQPENEGETAEPAQPQAPRPVVLPRRVQRSAPRVVQNVVEEDRGFEEELPYDEAGADESAVAGLPIDGNGEDGDQRALMIPLAGGALFLALAGQLWYLNRRSSAALEPVLLDDE